MDGYYLCRVVNVVPTMITVAIRNLDAAAGQETGTVRLGRMTD